MVVVTGVDVGKASLDGSLSDIYITGFIAPYTGETPEQVKARVQSVAAEDGFTAVMVESYRLASDDTLLDIVHQLLPLYSGPFQSQRKVRRCCDGGG